MDIREAILRPGMVSSRQPKSDEPAGSTSSGEESIHFTGRGICVWNFSTVRMGACNQMSFNSICELNKLNYC